MMACWIFICGIFFSSVDCESGLELVRFWGWYPKRGKADVRASFVIQQVQELAPPHHHEPLKRLLKRTINHVKLFLGDFERKIKDSRYIVRQIHNQSLISHNYTRTKINNIDTLDQPTLLNQDQDTFANSIYAMNSSRDKVERFGKNTIKNPPLLVNRAVEERRANLTEHFKNLKCQFAIEDKYRPIKETVASPTNKYRPIEGSVGSSTTNVTKVVKHSKYFIRQGPVRLGVEEVYRSKESSTSAASSTLYPKNLIFQGPTRFAIKEEFRNKRVFTSNANVLESSTINVKSRQRPAMLKIEPMTLKQEFVDTEIFIKGLTPDTTKKPNRLLPQGPERIKSKVESNSQRNLYEPIIPFKGKKISQQGFTRSQLTVEDIKEVHGINNTKYVKQISSTKVKDIDNFKQVQDNVIVKHNNIPNSKSHYTLSKFHFRLKGDVLSERTADYPDIFYRLVTTPALTTTKAVKTQYTLFTTEPTTEYIGVVVPALTDDYKDINFRVESSDEANSPASFYSNPLPKSSILNKPYVVMEKSSQESKYISPKYTHTTSKSRRNNIKNDNLRRIIDPSSYSVSDEETIIRVNLLDQLYHYNKSTHENPEHI